MTQPTKPALGIVPHHIWIANRIAELSRCITRQREFLDMGAGTQDQNAIAEACIMGCADEIVALGKRRGDQ